MGTAYASYPTLSLENQLLLHIQTEVFSLEYIRKLKSRPCHKDRHETRTFCDNKHRNSDTKFESQL